MKGKQSRRKFILNSSKFLGTVIGIISIGKYFPVAQSKSTTFMDKSFAKNTDNKILVAYDSQFGSTAEIAKYIGENLSTHQEIDILKINEVKDLSLYSDVIIGSAIQYDKWMPEAQDFIVKNESELSSKSVSFFLVCLALSKKTEKAKLQVNGYADKIKALVPNLKIKDFGKFAGVLDYSKMSIGQRILAKVLFAILGVKEGDYRDWDEMQSWSKGAIKVK